MVDRELEALLSHVSVARQMTKDDDISDTTHKRTNATTLTQRGR
jgi:hypothetical protein